MPNLTTICKKPAVQTIFLGGLKSLITKCDLLKHFAKYGQINSIFLQIDPKTHLNKGFAFLSYKTAASVDKCLAEAQWIAGRKVDCRISLPNTDNNFFKSECNKAKLYVSGLRSEVNSEDLVNYFTKYGAVKHAYVILEPLNNSSKGFGFVYFNKPESAKLCLKLYRNKKSLWKVDRFNPELKRGNYNKFHQTIPSPQSQSQELEKSVVGSREKDQETLIPMAHEQRPGLMPSFPKIDNYNWTFTDSTRDRSHSSSNSSIQIPSQPPLYPNFQPAERENDFYQANGGHPQINHHGFESSTFNHSPNLNTADYQQPGPQYAMPNPGQYPFQH
jgi:RNA recognition motif-containing protein